MSRGGVRTVTYGTRCCGFIDAGRRSGKTDDDVNASHRNSICIAVLLDSAFVTTGNDGLILISGRRQ